MLMKNLRNLFNYFDKNKDGVINTNDFKHIINILNLPILIKKNKIQTKKKSFYQLKMSEVTVEVR